ncbi:N-alpha-acetyltransferase 16, NatA auxiliary subunit [Borealophlyctis nickersoniae]|nr:N-alpha-acetyltransferase 16, NatA auxiliary subunit [Borealophlyctis nickersoniae]
MSAASGKQGRELPAKESSVFKSILKFYEHKQYKKGLKAAEQILKKFPNHGETLAMKGLFLSHLERKEEAHEFIKMGLKNDLMSHICWHVYGLLHRAEKNYEEAIKCYSHALKYDKENIQIIRDYSLLQIQMRNYEGFNETRHQLLSLKPQNRMYWVGLAISYHLLQKYDTAVNVIAAFEDSLKDQPEGVIDFENSELLLYKNLILEESGDYNKALDDLAAIRTKVVDQRGWKEAKARIQLKAGKLVEAEVEYRKLLADNPDCHSYLNGLLQARGLVGDLDEANAEKLFRLLNELGSKYPRSHVIKRMPLKRASGKHFRALIDEYLKPMFRKGVPSLFISLKDLYADKERATIIEEVVVGYANGLEKNGTFGTGDGDDVPEPPSAYLWVLLFLAQHFDWKKDTAKALELIDKALAHTPTLVEVLMAKARILKHAGDPEAAMQVMNQAREIDLQDRNINSKCTKYMLRNDKMADAEKTITLFTRSESTDPLHDLVDMQCMWFALECGESWARQGQYGRALKRFHQVEKHFADIYDDQFDFHSYCLRKMTLRAYLDLLRTDDKLRAHPYYYKAAVGAIKVYLNLHDKPKGGPGEAEGLDLANMTEAERKKALRKARKAELKSESTQKVDTVTATGGGGKKKVVDDDPHGKKFIDGVDYLAEGTKFLRPLIDLSPGRIEGWNMAAAVYLRKGKYLLALKALQKAKQLDPTDPHFHINSIRFCNAITSKTATIHPTVKQVLDVEVPTVFGGETDMAKLNRSYLAEWNGKDARRVLAAGEAMALVEPNKREEAAGIVAGIVKGKGLEGLGLQDAVAIHQSLVNTFKDVEKAGDFKAKCREKFSNSMYFRDA